MSKRGPQFGTYAAIPFRTHRSELSGLEAPGTLVQLVARLVLEEALKAESRDALGRDGYARGVRPGHGTLNGNRTGRLKTTEGSVESMAPQIAGRDEPFRSRIRPDTGATPHARKPWLWRGWCGG
ncbi:MAG: hypothetical protein OXI81_08910 [Paracoccaceae bacterium]|nr:hypothetical protein [Paracoccaceae bacterium]